VEVGGGGKIATIISELFKLPPEVEVAHESVVPFELHDGRVYHRDMEVGISGLRVRTSGSVGLDETLDLLAEVHLKLSEQANAERPLLSALGHQTLRLPIDGNLEKPKVNFKMAGESALGVVEGTLNQLGKDGERPVAELLNMLRERISAGKSSADEAPAGDSKEGGGSTSDGIGAQIIDRAAPILDQWLKHRRERIKHRRDALEEQ